MRWTAARSSGFLGSSLLISREGLFERVLVERVRDRHRGLNAIVASSCVSRLDSSLWKSLGEMIDKPFRVFEDIRNGLRLSAAQRLRRFGTRRPRRSSIWRIARSSLSASVLDLSLALLAQGVAFGFRGARALIGFPQLAGRHPAFRLGREDFAVLAPCQPQLPLGFRFAFTLGFGLFLALGFLAVGVGRHPRLRAGPRGRRPSPPWSDRRPGPARCLPDPMRYLRSPFRFR
jgi:hypothetical protein